MAPSGVRSREVHGEMELKGKRVAILVEKMYEDLELWYPYHRLREAGAEGLHGCFN